MLLSAIRGSMLLAALSYLLSCALCLNDPSSVPSSRARAAEATAGRAFIEPMSAVFTDRLDLKVLLIAFIIWSWILSYQRWLVLLENYST